ncbi:hypothetical protein SETIT_9G342400v2 [Setaria italica]|uniref:Uncharacterized protein n=1 Tax=Setaria italica TaxID=4555 RepID=A0A368SNP0_SETIT|nr:hypothetical protein SETIT_9G342400v2 [Setaria italica]
MRERGGRRWEHGAARRQARYSKLFYERKSVLLTTKLSFAGTNRGWFLVSFVMNFCLGGLRCFIGYIFFFDLSTRLLLTSCREELERLQDFAVRSGLQRRASASSGSRERLRERSGPIQVTWQKKLVTWVSTCGPMLPHQQNNVRNQVEMVEGANLSGFETWRV